MNLGVFSIFQQPAVVFSSNPDMIILLCILKVKAPVAPPPAVAPAAPENIEMGVLNLAADAGFEPVDLHA